MSGIGDYVFWIDRLARTVLIWWHDFGGVVKLIFDAESFQIWKAPGHHYWSGQGRPWNYAPALDTTL